MRRDDQRAAIVRDLGGDTATGLAAVAERTFSRKRIEQEREISLPVLG